MTIEEFIRYLDLKVNHATEAEMLTLYDKEWTLSLNGNEVKIPLDAVSYNAFTEALEQINSEE